MRAQIRQRAAQPLRRKRGLLPEGQGRGAMIKAKGDEFVHKPSKKGSLTGNFHARPAAVKTGDVNTPNCSELMNARPIKGMAARSRRNRQWRKTCTVPTGEHRE
jgi:hypothetical protein